MKKLLFISALFSLQFLNAQDNYGEIIGKIIDEYKVGIPSVLIYTESNGTIYKARTDVKGDFRISAVPAGKYTLKIVAFEDTMHNIAANVPMDGFAKLGDIKFEAGQTLTTVVIEGKKDAYMLEYNPTTAIRLSGEELMRMPAKVDQKDLLTAMSSEIRKTEDGELVFRGARKGDMIYMMDGVKTTDISNVPSSSIGNMMIFTGGIPAKYGDTLGGVVIMETKSYFDLYRAWRSRQ